MQELADVVILTDAPERTGEWTASLMGSGSVKTSFTGSSATAADWWWPRLGAAGVPARQVIETTSSLADWPLLIAVAQATGSQYDALVAGTRDPAAPPLPVAALALAGEGFHGNRGRPWQALPGNLHLSAALPVDLPAAECAPVLPALAAVALTDALLAVCGPQLPARIKWINDVLLGEAKIGGVLASAQLLGPRITNVAVGIGLNLRTAPPVVPTLFVPAVSCLAEHAAGAAAAAAPGALVAALLAALTRRVTDLAARGPGPLAADYQARCQDVGRRVAVWAEGLPDTDDPANLPPPVARGLVTGIGADLSLLIDGHATPLGGGRLAYTDRE